MQFHYKMVPDLKQHTSLKLFPIYNSDGRNQWSVSASYVECALWILMTQEKWESNAVGHSPITVLMATAAFGSLSLMCKGALCSGTHSCTPTLNRPTLQSMKVQCTCRLYINIEKIKGLKN